MDVILHHEATEESDKEEDGSELLGSEGEASRIAFSDELVCEDANADEMDAL